MAKVLSNDMLSDYLEREIEALNDNGTIISPFGFPAIKLTWKGTKAELQEQILSWDSAATFGDVPLTKLYEYIQNVFNIQLDSNLSRSFGELKIRLSPTPFLDKLKMPYCAVWIGNNQYRGRYVCLKCPILTLF